MGKFFNIKKSFSLVAIVALLLLFAGPAMAANDHYVIYVYADNGYSQTAGGYTQVTSDIRYIVFNGGTLTPATLYKDSGSTARSNPVESATFEVDDKIDFYIADTVTSVDIAIMSLDGYAEWIRGATTSTRQVVLDKRPGVKHHGFMDWYLTLASQDGLTGTATDYWTIPSDILIDPNVGWEVMAESSLSDFPLRIGVNGTDNVFGFGGYFTADDAYAWQAPSALYSVTDSPSYGSLFVNSEKCTADVRTYSVPVSPYLVESAVTVGFTTGSIPDEGDYETVTNDKDWGWGFFHYWFTRLR